MTAAPATDLRLHYALFLDLLNAALAPRMAYRFGEVPGLDSNAGTPPTLYALLDVQRRYYLPQSLSAQPDVTGWVVSVRGVGRTVSEAAWVLDRTVDTLESTQVVLDGQTTTPLTFDTSDPIASDGDVFSGLASYTYVL